MSQQLRSVGAVSVAKVCAVLYALVGLVIGAVLSLVFTLASQLGGSTGIPAEMGALNVFFGFGSIILAPLFYGIAGAVGGLIMAGLYNLVARLTGGIEIEIG
jgi:hypothetical protein